MQSGFLGAVLALVALGGPGAAEPAPRTLVLVVDSIPYDVIARLTDPVRGEAALFQGFQPPAALISSFPSSSNLAITGILEPFGVGRAPGYESRFFDRDRNRLRGGGPISYHLIPFPWRDHFDWRVRSQILRGFGDLRAAHTSKWEIDRAMRAFLASDSPLFFAYVATTDKLAHFEGPEGLVPVVEHLDEVLRRAAENRPERPFRTLILSDHGIAGGQPLTNLLGPFRAALEAAGHRSRSRLREPGDVVFAPMGLVSSVEAFTLPGEEEAVARILAGVEGVDLCVLREAGGLRVVSARGEALVMGAAGSAESRWAYRPVTGDPLRYAPVVEALRLRDGRATALWFPDAWWFEATREHRYPDALYRLQRAFDLVENPASVICSLTDEAVFGARLTELGAWVATGKLRWSHGALARQASLGFLLTDSPAWNPSPVVRFDRALIPLTASPAPRTSGPSP